ncbi:DUF6346 domain-containing protein [Amycolatopsis sp. NPDC049252]|uniref:DUF6346 domain-containing protein n=1 Tax=Amycolatopsis sp. NPDC049252 TaxID=3363933 RepID=UPI003714B4BF
MTSLPTGYESVPVVRRRRWLKTAGTALVLVVLGLGVWTAIARGSSRHGPDTPSDVVARATSCDRVGPVSRGGIGFYWSCTAEVTQLGRTRVVRFGLDELTPADIGRPVPVFKKSSTDFKRSAEKRVPWWSIVPAIGFLLVCTIWAVSRRRRRLRYHVTPWLPTTQLASLTRLQPTSDAPGTGRGSHKIAPGDWSARRYWLTAGALMVFGAACAVTGTLASPGDGREILTTLGLFGLTAPIWLIVFTPRWHRSRATTTALTISADGIGWYRRSQTSFTLGWAEVAEVRLITVTHQGLVLRMVDVFLAPTAVARQDEVRGLWELGAEIEGQRLPAAVGAIRLPEAFSDSAACQVREAMAAFRADLFQEFTVAVAAGAPPTPITRGAT